MLFKAFEWSQGLNTRDGMIEQMMISKRHQADGVVFFSSNSLAQPFLDRLKAVR